MGKKILILDGSSLLYRAFYALDFLTTKDGLHTNAAYGFTRMLLGLLAEIKPDRMVIAFDKGKTNFRHTIFTEYKAHRSATPPELVEQFPLARQIAECMGISVVETEGYEADDIIGTLAYQAEVSGLEVLIVSGDRDVLQLVRPGIRVLLTKKGISDMENMDEAGVFAKYGVEPVQLIDLKALMGDKSDNIPGVPGIGEKTAVKLIQQFGSLENVYEHISEVSGKKVQENLRENKELAFISQKLAVIECKMPIEFHEENFAIRMNYHRLEALLQKLEFRTLLNKIPREYSEDTSGLDPMFTEQREFPVACIVDESFPMKEFLFLIEKNQKCYIWPVYTGQGPDLHIDGLAVGNGSAEVYIKANHSGWLETLKIIEDEKICKSIYDSKPLWHGMENLGMQLAGVGFDGVVAAYLLEPTRNNYDFTALVSEYNRAFAPERPAATVADAAVWSVGHLGELERALIKRLEELQLYELYRDVELPLIAVLASMEHAGIRVDRLLLEDMAQKIGEKIESLLADIYRLADKKFNVNSTKQLGSILFEELGLPAMKKTKTGYSTDAEVLEQLRGKHDIVDKLLEYRVLTKLKSTYLDGLKQLIHEKTGRVHTHFNQTVTATGRLSSSEPNLQNIPIRTEIGKKIRELFIPGDGYDMLMSADYSQIELRILAHMSQDPNFMEAFLYGQDVHARTAAEVFGVPLQDVTGEMRGRAKAVNFGIVYGISDYGLARDLQVSRKEAAMYIENYFARCHGVKSFIDKTVEEAKQRGYVSTMLGRRRYLPDINSTQFNQRSFAERTAVNTPIQGTAADIIKKAMVDLSVCLRKQKLKSRILLQVHDELVLEVTREELDEVRELVCSTMEGALQLSVPLDVEVHTGKDWADAK